MKRKLQCKCVPLQRAYRDSVSFTLLMVSGALALLSFLFFMMPVILF